MAPFGLSVFFLVVCFLDFPCGFTQLIGAVWKPHDSHADPVMPFRHLRRSSSRDGNASQSMWTLVEQTNKSIVYNWEAGARACCQKIACWSKYGTIWWKKRRLNENFMKIWETKNSFLFLGQKLRTAHFLGPKSRMCAEICRKKKNVLLRFRQPLEAGSNPLSLTSNTLPVMSRTMQARNPHVLWSKRWVALVAFRCFWFWYLFCFAFFWCSFLLI